VQAEVAMGVSVGWSRFGEEFAAGGGGGAAGLGEGDVGGAVGRAGRARASGHGVALAAPGEGAGARRRCGLARLRSQPTDRAGGRGGQGAFAPHVGGEPPEGDSGPARGFGRNPPVEGRKSGTRVRESRSSLRMAPFGVSESRRFLLW